MPKMRAARPRLSSRSGPPCCLFPVLYLGIVVDKNSSLSLIHLNRSKKNKSAIAGTPCRRAPFIPCPISDRQKWVDIMTRILLATVAALAFATSAFAAETGKTVGQSPSSFYLAQDTATMKCQIVESQPAAGGSMKVVGAAHTTKASAEAALKADKTCK